MKAHITYDDVTKKLYISDEEAIYSDEDAESWESEDGHINEQQKQLMNFL